MSLKNTNFLYIYTFILSFVSYFMSQTPEINRTLSYKILFFELFSQKKLFYSRIFLARGSSGLMTVGKNLYRRFDKSFFL